MRCALTATSDGLVWPEASACGLLPSRLASVTVPAMKSVQYRWPGSTPVPDSESVARTVLSLAAVRAAVALPPAAGADPPPTPPGFPGPPLGPGPPSPGMGDPARPRRRTRTAPPALPPPLAPRNLLQALL